MTLTVHVPDDLAARLVQAGASPERLALDALHQAADALDERRREGDRTGEALIAALQASPVRDLDLAPPRGPMPVRDVTL